VLLRCFSESLPARPRSIELRQTQKKLQFLYFIVSVLYCVFYLKKKFLTKKKNMSRHPSARQQIVENSVLPEQTRCAIRKSALSRAALAWPFFQGSAKPYEHPEPEPYNFLTRNRIFYTYTKRNSENIRFREKKILPESAGMAKNPERNYTDSLDLIFLTFFTFMMFSLISRYLFVSRVLKLKTDIIN
jgi:hypothetical protein